MRPMVEREENTAVRTAYHVMFGVGIVFTILMAGVLITYGYWYDRDLDSVIDRAQVAADREDMIEYLTKLKVNMEHHGLTHGHTALLFTNDRNDMALHFKTVNRVIERLEASKELKKTDTAYQVLLDDVRGIIRELPNPAMGWLWVTWGWWLGLCLVVIWGAVFVLSCYSDRRRGNMFR
jgi:hypothetical protein